VAVPSHRSRRRLIGAAVLSLLLVAPACGSGGGSGGGGGGAAAGPITLRFSWWGSDSRQQYTQKLIDQYEAAHPGITIEPDFTSFTDYWDRLATATAGGDAPDVMQQDTRYVSEYAERGALAELDQFIPAVIDTKQLDQEVLTTGKVEDKSYAIPTGVNAFSIVADPEVFAAAGVPLPDDKTWTWDQMVQIAGQVSAKTDGDVWGMQDPGFNETGLEIMARQRGESLFNADGDVGLSRRTVVDWWNHILAARDSGAEPPASITVEAENAGIDQSLTATHRAGLGFWWTNELPSLSKSSGRDLKLLRWPGESPTAGMYYKPAMFWSMSKSSEHQKEAAEFINFLINSPEAAQLILSDRGLPINTTLRAQIVGKLSPADQKSAAFMADIGPALKAPPRLPPKGAGEVQRILQQLNEQVLFGQLTVEQAADEFLSQVDAATT
jgi:multiple sugar transport system substrate-binding protein